VTVCLLLQEGGEKYKKAVSCPLVIFKRTVVMNGPYGWQVLFITQLLADCAHSLTCVPDAGICAHHERNVLIERNANDRIVFKIVP
jgi:hypothetical protein